MNHNKGNQGRGGRRTLGWAQLGWEDIDRELTKCDVLCANCHRRVTAAGYGLLNGLPVGTMPTQSAQQSIRLWG